MPVSILLTRNPAQNFAMRTQILAHLPGSSIVTLPLLETLPLTLNQSSRNIILALEQFDLIIFISHNAVLLGVPQLKQYWPTWPVKLRWYAIGPATAKPLSDWHIRAHWPALASSEGLLLKLAGLDMTNKKVLIVRGAGGREALKAGLASRGAVITYLEVYERVPVSHAASTIESIPSGALSMVYSGEALTRLAELLQDRIQDFAVIVPSQRLKLMATALGFGKVNSANSQQDMAMLEALKDQHP